MRTARLLALLLFTSVATVACWLTASSDAYPFPPRPTQTLHAEQQGVVTADTWLDCYRHRFSLDTGAEVELNVGTSRCSAEPSPTITAFLPTTNFASGPGLSVGAYVYVGHFEDGRVLYFEGLPFTRIEGCRYVVGAGAFGEGTTFHLSNGLVVSKAPDFEYIWGDLVSQAERLTDGPRGEACVNAAGELDLIQYMPTAGE